MIKVILTDISCRRCHVRRRTPRTLRPCSLTIVRGEDRVTLLTCWPYGVNTKRLIVSGVRASMPDVAPFERDAERGNPILGDWFTLSAVATLPCSIGYTGWTGWQTRRERKLLPYGRHSAK
ncbi:hypothetical protein EMO90_03510 [Bifidobacterium vespertilionis]|uniref:Sortase n=1 Tax=Bifidobacterium vespertilionis TaxID=2562524 RepID=A0A5J5DXU2_9BIFI|nr:hypothetical protein EMO90_03510 [Bifidobacterium vespertilionis]KAA8824781.1 hypothetical protein EM848_00805 [Bifidobacterium vespertilionis]